MIEPAAQRRWFDSAALGDVAAKFIALFNPPAAPYLFPAFLQGIQDGAEALSPSRPLKFQGQPVAEILDELKLRVPPHLQRIKPQWSDDELRGEGSSPYRSLAQETSPEAAGGYKTLKGILLGLLLARRHSSSAATKSQIDSTIRFIRLASAEVHLSHERERRQVVASLPSTFVPSKIQAALGLREHVPTALHPRLDELAAATRALSNAFPLLFQLDDVHSPGPSPPIDSPQNRTRASRTKKPVESVRWASIESDDREQTPVTYLFGAHHPTKDRFEIAATAETPDDYSIEADACIIEFDASLSKVKRYEISARYQSDVRQGFWARTQWDALSPAEMRHAVELLGNVDATKWPHLPESVVREAVALGLLCASTSLPAAKSHSLRSKESTGNLGDDCLDILKGVVHLRLPGADDRYKPRPEQVPFLRPVVDVCSLSLPVEAFEAVRRLTPDPDGYVFCSELHVLEGVIREIFAGSRKDEPRATLPRLCRGHQLGILTSCSDVAMAQIISGQPLGTTTNPLAYYSAQPERIQATFDATVQVHGFTPRPSDGSVGRLPTGSRLLLTDEAYASMVKAAFRGVSNKPRLARTEGRPLLELHEFTVRALASLWMSATSFRPTFRLGEVRATDIDWWSGLCVIADKVSEDGHEGRLAPLTPVLQDSLGAYGWLLERMSVERKLPSEVRKAAKRALDGRAPLFFVVTSSGVRPLTPHDLEVTLPEGWNVPANFRRHRLATRLREVDCPGIYIQALMGHHELGIQPHGSESFQNPLDFVQSTRDHIQRALTEDGWKPLLGGIGTLDHFRNAAPAVGIRAAHLEAEHEARAGKRYRLWRKQVEDLRKSESARIANDVRDVIGRVKPSLLSHPDKAHELEKETVSELRRAVCDGADGLAEIELRVDELRKVLLAGRKEYGWTVPILPRFFLNQPKPSVHVPEMVPYYRAMVRIRKAFTDGLADAKRNASADSASRNLLLALVLWHGVSSWERLEGILNGLPESEVIGQAGVALAVPVAIARYESDPRPTASAEVLFGPVAVAALRSRAQGVEWTRELASELIHSWLPTEVVRCKQTQCLDVLFGLASIAHRFEAPGPVRHVWNGDYVAVGMPMDRLRALFGMPNPASTPPTSEPPETKTDVAKGSGASARRFTWLTETLKIAKGTRNEFPDFLEGDAVFGQMARVSGTAFSGSGTSSKRRNAAIDLLTLAIQAWSEDGSLIRALTAYALDRLKNGTPWSSEVTPDTVFTYVRVAGNTIFKYDPDFQLATHEAEALTEIYSTLVNSSAWKNREKLRDYLTYFHLFLVDHELAPPVALGSRRSRRRSLPEVGYVAPAEVLASEQLLDIQRISLDSQLGTLAEPGMARVALAIGFAAGTRTGETANRESRELVTERGRRALLVRKNRLARVKTFHSNRVVDLEPYMPDASWDYVTEWQTESIALRGPEERRTSALLSTNVDGRTAPAPASLSRMIGNTLRTVTGRSDARAYWMRHTSASNDALALFGTEAVHSAIRDGIGRDQGCWYPDADRVRNSLGGSLPLGQAHAAGFRSRRGHATMRTPCETYTHTWNLVEPWPSRDASNHLSGDAMASLTGVSPTTLRKRLSRAPIPKRSPQAALLYLIQQAEKLEPTQQLGQPEANDHQEFPASIKPDQLAEALIRSLKRRSVDALCNALHLTRTTRERAVERLDRLERQNGFGLNLGFDLAPTKSPQEESSLLGSKARAKALSFARLKKPWVLDCVMRMQKDPELTGVWDLVGRGLDPRAGIIHVQNRQELDLLMAKLPAAIGHGRGAGVHVVALIDPLLASTKKSQLEAQLETHNISEFGAMTKVPSGWFRVGFAVAETAAGRRVIAGIATVVAASALLQAAGASAKLGTDRGGA